MKKKILRAIAMVILILTIIIIGVFIYIAQPTTRSNKTSNLTIDPSKLEAHVIALSKNYYPRNYRHIENLEKTASYIQNHFAFAGAQVDIQEFVVSDKTYKNIIGKFGNGKSKTFIVGAHYDSFENTPGANDNASGIAGLIELAYLLGKQELPGEIELVAYSLEEPPYFRTTQMGSYVHASKYQGREKKVHGVIVLEMIGYFLNSMWSQKYPIPLLYLYYPFKGNYIAVVGRLDQRKFTKSVKIGMKGATDLPVYSINAPMSLPGIDFSDHRNYWPLDINAVMVTDTAFYRNPNYHALSDTFESLDYDKMGKVVISVYEALRAMLG